jgi:hypothetical protein
MSFDIPIKSPDIIGIFGGMLNPAHVKPTCLIPLIAYTIDNQITSLYFRL